MTLDTTMKKVELGSDKSSRSYWMVGWGVGGRYVDQGQGFWICQRRARLAFRKCARRIYTPSPSSSLEPTSISPPREAP